MYKTCLSAGREQITCSGGLEYRCWNSIYVDIPLTQSKISAAILNEIQRLDGFTLTFPKQLENAVRMQSLTLEIDRPKLERKIDELNRKIKNVTSAIAQFGFSAELNDELKSLVEERDEAKYQLSKLEQQRPTAMRIPTLDEIVGSLKEQLQLAMNEDDEAQRLLCRALPDIFIRPVELCDLRCVQPQAVMTLDLQPLAERLIGHSLAAGFSKTQLVVNLFEECGYVRHAAYIGTAEHRGQRIVDAGADVGLMSMGDISAARKLYKIMHQRNLVDPWLPLTEPPARGWKGKRHLHPRYRFEPLPGFESPKAA